MPDWDSTLMELRAEFVREARRKLDDIGGLLAELRRDPADRGVLQAAMRRFHGFAGSGTTYGFPQVTALGKKAEEECATLLQAASAPSLLDLERWGGIVSQLRGALAVEEPPREPSASEAAEAPRCGPDILIVDDDAQLVELLSKLMRDEGLSVRGVTTRGAAIQAIAERMPDGMIVDIRLPDGSGYDVVKHVRSLPQGETPAVLILSMLTGFLDKVEAIHCGADGYFEKPVDWDALMRRLLHLLRKASPESPRVLSVEDDPLQAAFLRKVLESAGYEFRLCEDPKRFESELISFRPDLVLMDIVLPGMSGYDLVRYVRQDERHATLPVLFLTTEGQVDAQIRTARAGGDDHLMKPISPSLLLTAVAARIERSRFLKSLLERDGLTRLLTHTAFVERAQQAVSRKGTRPTRPHSGRGRASVPGDTGGEGPLEGGHVVPGVAHEGDLRPARAQHAHHLSSRHAGPAAFAAQLPRHHVQREVAGGPRVVHVGHLRYVGQGAVAGPDQVQPRGRSGDQRQLRALRLEPPRHRLGVAAPDLGGQRLLAEAVPVVEGQLPGHEGRGAADPQREEHGGGQGQQEAKRAPSAQSPPQAAFEPGPRLHRRQRLQSGP